MKAYLLQIWDLQTLAADWGQLQSLLARPPASPPASSGRFAALAQALAARAAPSRQRDDPWAEGLEPPTHEACWAMAINPLQLGRAWNLLVEEAGALGLSIFDAEGELLVRPDGVTLTPGGRGRWRPLPESVLTPPWLRREHFLDEQRRQLLPVLEPLGFAMATDEGDLLGFERQTALGRQRIELAGGDSDGQAVISLSVALLPDWPAGLSACVTGPKQIWLEFEPPFDGALQAFFRADPSRGMFPGRWVAANAAALRALMALIGDFLLTRVMPILEACRSRDELLAYDLGEPRSGIRLRPTMATLALAHWAGVADFDDRVTRIRARIPSAQAYSFPKALELIRAWPRPCGLS